MSIDEILITILTSATVSGIITVLLKALITSRQAHRYAIELEEIKTRLSEMAAIQQAILMRRITEYPMLAQQIYACRKIAQELCHNAYDEALHRELVEGVKGLRQDFAKFRLDIERDGLSNDLHRFKTLVENFALRVSQVTKDKEKDTIARELMDLFQPIDQLYSKLVSDLAGLQIQQSDENT